MPIPPTAPRDRQDPLRYIAAVSMSVSASGHPCSGGSIEVNSQLPEGRGFSSSAALCVATAQAMLASQGAVLTPRRLARIAYEAERERVGVPCGLLDQLACAFARPLLIDWGERTPRIHGVRLGAPLHLVVGTFPEPRDTLAILGRLRDLHEGTGLAGEARVVRDTLAGWGQSAQEGAQALADGEIHRLGALMNLAQQSYEEEFASRFDELKAPRLREACATLREADALGAKFSGAGGDGSVVALAENKAHASALASLLRAMGMEAWSLPTLSPVRGD